MKGREDPNTTESGPTSARQQNAIGVSLADDDGPILNAGLVALWFSEDPDQHC